MAEPAVHTVLAAGLLWAKAPFHRFRQWTLDRLSKVGDRPHRYAPIAKRLAAGRQPPSLGAQRLTQINQQLQTCGFAASARLTAGVMTRNVTHDSGTPR